MNDPVVVGDDMIQRLLARTPARLMVGRAGPGYRTDTRLRLRTDHAFARDAVQTEFHLTRDLGDLVERFGLFEVTTRAGSKSEYLRRPDLGRRLSEVAAETIRAECSTGADFQVVIGDGLSAPAVAAQVPGLLPLLAEQAANRGWRFGRPFAVRYCRVGALNDLGELLNSTVIALLIGERPGLATADSLSVYLAYRPRAGQTDADRNLVCNIHARGVSVSEAAGRVARLAEAMMRVRTGGIQVKEEFPAVSLSGPDSARR